MTVDCNLGYNTFTQKLLYLNTKITITRISNFFLFILFIYLKSDFSIFQLIPPPALRILLATVLEVRVAAPVHR